jgi:hypothetical protein
MPAAIRGHNVSLLDQSSMKMILFYMYYNLETIFSYWNPENFIIYFLCTMFYGQINTFES